MKPIDGIEPHTIRTMVDQLADARVELAEKSGRDVSEADERKFAHSFVKNQIADIQRDRLTSDEPKLTLEAQEQLLQAVLDTSFHGAQIWRVWNEYPTATNLSIYGGEPARLETADGRIISLPPIVQSNDELRAGARALRSIAGEPDARWDPTYPELELVIDSDGTRITAVDYITDQPYITLRRPTLADVTLPDLVANGTLSDTCARFLEACVHAKQRIVIAGSMNSGKTVMLRALAATLDPDSAVMTAESIPELRLDKFPDTYPRFVVPMVARRPNTEGKNGVSVRDLITHIQRMSPSVVIVGEVRGEEAVALSAALAQGYQVMSTIHAISSADGVANAALYYQEHAGATFETSLARFAMGIDIVIHMDRRPSDNQRIVGEVAVIDRVVEGTMKYEVVFDDSQSQAELVGVIPDRLLRTLRRVGYGVGKAIVA